MKKFSFILLLNLLALSFCLAAPRSYQQARQIALQKAASLGISNARAALRGAPSGEVGSEDKAYYLFDNGGDNGFVIVSGDDRLPEVIGYATHGMLSEDNMPVQLKSLLDAFEKQYEAIADDDAKMQIAIAERKALAEASLAANISVSPLLGEIAWGQDTPFNDQCPLIGDTHAVTGCVATAMGQLIRYHQYPSQLQADIPGYTTKSSITLPAISTSEAVYEYEKMLPKYVTGSYTEEQGEDVAKLLYHCGCSVMMEYGAPVPAHKTIERLAGLVVDLPQMLRAFCINCPAHEAAIPNASRRKPNAHRGGGKQCRQTFAHPDPLLCFSHNA